MFDLHPEFVKGAWFAYNEVLGLINTLDQQMVDKSELYKQVMFLRPQSLLSKANEESE